MTNHYSAFGKTYVILKSINPFHAIVPFLYPLKTSENLLFSDVFRGGGGGIEMGHWREKG